MPKMYWHLVPSGARAEIENIENCQFFYIFNVSFATRGTFFLKLLCNFYVTTPYHTCNSQPPICMVLNDHSQIDSLPASQRQKYFPSSRFLQVPLRHGCSASHSGGVVGRTVVAGAASVVHTGQGSQVLTSCVEHGWHWAVFCVVHVGHSGHCVTVFGQSVLHNGHCVGLLGHSVLHGGHCVVEVGHSVGVAPAVVVSLGEGVGFWNI